MGKCVWTMDKICMRQTWLRWRKQRHFSTNSNHHHVSCVQIHLYGLLWLFFSVLRFFCLFISSQRIELHWVYLFYFIWSPFHLSQFFSYHCFPFFSKKSLSAWMNGWMTMMMIMMSPVCRVGSLCRRLHILYTL